MWFRLFWFAIFGAFSIVSMLSQSRPARNSITIDGVVTRLEDGKPLSEVEVAVINPADTRVVATVRTSSAGVFEFRAVPPGRYELRVRKSGFRRAPFSAPSLPITIANQQPVHGLKFQMVETLEVAGKILDADANPVGGVHVRLMRETYSRTGVRWLNWAEPAAATTDVNGRYEILGVVPDDYYLVVFPGKDSPSFLPLFYPGVTGVGNAREIRVSSGVELHRFDFSLLSNARYSIRLSAPRPPNLSSGIVEFSLRSVDQGKLRTSFTHKTDFQSLGSDAYRSPAVPPGSYVLDVVWGSMNRASASVMVEDRDVDLGTIVPRPYRLAINGRILGTSLNATLVSFDNLEPEAGTIVAPRASPEGEFRITEMPPGRFAILRTPAAEQNRLYVASARLDGHEVIGNVFEISDTQEGEVLLEVTFRSDVAAVQGKLLDVEKQPVAYGRVILVPSRRYSENPHLFVTRTSDQNGAFSFQAVPPGEYEMLAWDSVEEFAYLNEDFLRRFEGTGVRMVLAPNSRNEVLLRPATARE